MIAARALEGAGGAALSSMSLALIAVTFPERQARTRALALSGSVAGIGATLGLAIGGLVTLLSWRLGFAINVPIDAALIIAAWRLLPRTAGTRARLDIAGAGLSTIGVGALVPAVLWLSDGASAVPIAIACAAASVQSLALFVVVERRSRNPLVPRHLFASRSRVGGHLGRMLFSGAMGGFFFITSHRGVHLTGPATRCCAR